MQAMFSATSGSAASETLRNAYNAAFDELELGWHWCESQFRELLRHDDERTRMQAYLSAQQPHLLKAYDVDFFVDAVGEARRKYFRSLESIAAPLADARPDVPVSA
jgi:CRISPR/Cas system-associated endonuclease Cas1